MGGDEQDMDEEDEVELGESEEEEDVSVPNFNTQKLLIYLYSRSKLSWNPWPGLSTFGEFVLNLPCRITPYFRPDMVLVVTEHKVGRRALLLHPPKVLFIMIQAETNADLAHSPTNVFDHRIYANTKRRRVRTSIATATSADGPFTIIQAIV